MHISDVGFLVLGLAGDAPPANVVMAEGEGAAVVTGEVNTLPEGYTPAPALTGDPYSEPIMKNRVRPPYETNPAHEEGPLFNPNKTPEPVDAEVVYKGAIRTDMGTFYGVNSKGEIYQFFDNNAGKVHFSGIVPKGEVEGSILRQLGIKPKGK